MGGVVGISEHNRAQVLAVLKENFGRPDPTLSLGLAAPPHLHVLAEAIAVADCSTTQNQFWAYVTRHGEVLAVMAAMHSSLVYIVGHDEAAPHFAHVLRTIRWAILLGDMPLTDQVLSTWRRLQWWGPSPRTRRQLFFYATGPALDPAGFDPAYGVGRLMDLDAITDLAATLHVDDCFGPPLSHNARIGLHERMGQTVQRNLCWLLKEEGQVKAKLEIYNHSPVFGAQLSGVIVHPNHRGQGLGTRIVRAANAGLFHVGMPMVTLHTREDNYPAIRAYEKAGFTRHTYQRLVLA